MHIAQNRITPATIEGSEMGLVVGLEKPSV